MNSWSEILHSLICIYLAIAPIGFNIVSSKTKSIQNDTHDTGETFSLAQYSTTPHM